MKLIFGLGNPGKSYQYTLHNIGFLTVDSFLKNLRLEASREKFSSLYTRATILDEKYIFAKPLTFMNNSGRAVAPFFKSLNIESQDMVVIHDDIDIEEGKVRIKLGGGAGGHKGLISIMSHMGGVSDFLRIRVGVGRPPADMDPADYVLRRVTKRSLMPFVDAACEALEVLFREGYRKACNVVNK